MPQMAHTLRQKMVFNYLSMLSSTINVGYKVLHLSQYLFHDANLMSQFLIQNLNIFCHYFCGVKILLERISTHFNPPPMRIDTHFNIALSHQKIIILPTCFYVPLQIKFFNNKFYSYYDRQNDMSPSRTC